MDVCIRFYTPPIFVNEFAAAAGDTKHNTEKIWVFRVQGYIFSLSQWPNFKLLEVTYLVGKIKFNFFFQGPLAE